MNLNDVPLSETNIDENFKKPELNIEEFKKEINNCLKKEVLLKPIGSIDTNNMLSLSAKETIEQQLYNNFNLIEQKDYVSRVVYGLTSNGDVVIMGLKLSNINMKDGNIYKLNIPIHNPRSCYIKYISYGMSTSTDLDEVKKMLNDLPYDPETIYDLDNL